MAAHLVAQAARAVQAASSAEAAHPEARARSAAVAGKEGRTNRVVEHRVRRCPSTRTVHKRDSSSGR